MKIALLTTESREYWRRYDDTAPSFGTAPAALLSGLKGISEVEVHVISCTQQPLKSPSMLADNIYLHTLHVPKIGWMRTLYTGCVLAVRRKLREINPDIVHGQGTERDSAICAVHSGFPNVLTIHGNMRVVAQLMGARPFSFHWLAARLEDWSIRRSDGIVCITEYTRRQVESIAVKTWIVPNAVESEFFDVVPSSPSRCTLLYVGNIDRRKNQNAFIQAMDRLNHSENFQILFIGYTNRETPYAQEFFRLIETRPWCRFVGGVDRPGLRQHLAQARGLVLASIEDNCPMVVLEAMAAGVPVAASRVGGVPELIRDGETGLLFDPLDGDSMTRAVEKLLGSPALAIVAREEALRRFTPRVVAERHVEIYREVLAQVKR